MAFRTINYRLLNSKQDVRLAILNISKDFSTGFRSDLNPIEHKEAVYEDHINLVKMMDKKTHNQRDINLNSATKYLSSQTSVIKFSTNSLHNLSTSKFSIRFPVKSYSTGFTNHHLQTRVENDTFFINFNRPDKRNCLNFESIENLKYLLNKIDQNSDIRKIVLHGEGGNFCSGFDLNELKEENKQKLIDLLSDETWFQSNKLLISYVQGFAVGLGFELVLASDILIADHSSRFGFLNRRFGLPSFLPLRRYRNLIGRLKAIELIDNPGIINSKEAYELGLIKYQIDDDSSLIEILNSIEIDKRQLEIERAKLNINLNIHKSDHLPDEWSNHGLNASNYNLNKIRHGKYDLSFWEHIRS